MSDFVMGRRDFEALCLQGVLYLGGQRSIKCFPVFTDSMIFSSFTFGEDSSRIFRTDRASKIEPSAMKDALQTAVLVIGRFAETVAQILQLRNELCALFRVMREQFL